MKFRKLIINGAALCASIYILFHVYSAYSDPYNGFDLTRSTIPDTEIYPGGPRRDGIPALTDPEFEPADDVRWLKDNSRVLGIYLNGTAKAYPLDIMNWHEIVNDRLGDDFVLVTYCPLCFSGMAFDATISGKRHLFGVSGLLYNSDVLLYDRKTSSLWSQIRAQAISGDYAGRTLRAIPLENTTWQDWRSKYPETQVLSRNTGYKRNYEADPYIDYRESPETIFPVAFRAEGYHPKEPVIGIVVNNHPKAYPNSELSRSPGFVEDHIAGRKIVVIFNKDEQSGVILDPDCKPLPSVTLYWFAWYTFHPDTDIYKFSTTNVHSDKNKCHF